MLKIRLKRIGRKKQPIYRIIVIDSRKKRNGKAIDEVGCYNPCTKEIRVNIIKIRERIKKGAQLTNTVKFLMSTVQDKYT